MNGEQKPSLIQSEPAMVAGGVASIVGAIMAALLMAVSLGWLTLSPEQLDAIRNFLVMALAAAAPVLPLLVAWWTRGRVTPTADPKTEDGEPAMILPVAQAQAMGILPEGKGD
jgi:hypothetical protein